MRLRILGPLEVLDARSARVFITGQKRRALLATLVVRAGRTVSMDRLITELWGATPPANAINALQAHIGRLRKAVEPDRIVTSPPGYTMTLYPGETDAAEFAATLGRAKTLPPHASIPHLRTALALWRGPALDGCISGDICAAEAAMLEESRLTALETLYDANLQTGQHAEVIGELEECTGAYPLRERFYDQLMTALHRADRRSDALATYARARRRLITDLGVEPGPGLRAREQAIRTNRPAVKPTPADLSREVAELQERIETLATRVKELTSRVD